MRLAGIAGIVIEMDFYCESKKEEKIDFFLAKNIFPFLQKIYLSVASLLS